MMQPLISIITPCYNQGQFLKETVASVINQSYLNWEMIIVDDGSTDDTAVIANECKEQDSRITFMSQTNQGVSVARNNGVKVSKGKYILPLDGDDTIETNYIQRAVEYLEEHPECIVFYCLANKFGKENGPWDVMYTDYKSLLLGNAIFCSSIFRRTDFDRIGGYDESFVFGYEDWEFYIRLLAIGGYVYQDKARMFNYRIKDKNISHDALAQKNVERIFNDIYKKHFDIYTKFFSNFILSQKELLQYKASVVELQENVNHLSETLCLKEKTIVDKELEIEAQKALIKSQIIDIQRFIRTNKKYKITTINLGIILTILALSIGVFIL